MKKTIVSGILVLTLCFTMITGATFALFTSNSETNIAASSGKVEVLAKLENMTVYSPASIDLDGVVTDDTNAADTEKRVFANGGFASNDGEKITITNMTPGDRITFDIVIKNNSTVAILYQTVIGVLSDTGLFAGLVVKMNDVVYSGETVKSEWTGVAAGAAIVPGTIHVSMELPTTAGNEYQGTSAELYANVIAIQGNADATPKWSGEQDEASFEENTDIDNKIIEIYTAEELAALSASVAAGNTYAGYTVRLMENINLNNLEWKPIGSRTAPFSGSFDGQGHTISNLKITALDTADSAPENRKALFGTCVPSGATYIKNLTIKNADVTAGRNVGVLVAAVDGSSVSATGNHLAISGINITGMVTVDCYLGGGAILGSGSLSSLTDIHVNTEEGSYVSNMTNGATNTWSCVGSVQGFGYVSNIQNIYSNLDARGNLAGVGGILGVGGGSSDNKITCNMSNVTYSGTMTVNEFDGGTQWGKNLYCYSGLLIGSPRFTIVVNLDNCVSDGNFIALNDNGTVYTDNGMAEFVVDGCGSCFGAARDNAYTNKNFYKAYVAPDAE